MLSFCIFVYICMWFSLHLTTTHIRWCISVCQTRWPWHSQGDFIVAPFCQLLFRQGGQDVNEENQQRRSHTFTCNCRGLLRCFCKLSEIRLT